MGRDARARLRDFLREAGVEIVSCAAEHFDAAIHAFLRFGKGRHPAAPPGAPAWAPAVAIAAGRAQSNSRYLIRKTRF